ncbi:MAG: type II toxin-antitoxin system HicB family antitoxin [Bacteroidales bacterium]|jgi:predicted RNase H-like HicB family nuclease|nr:type II toxin-antitoxin system HicB family antitoxin [Bacteroidales bacterium]
MEYTILIHKDEKSGWYCGQCEQLPGAISQGATFEELMENMKEAISLILEYNKEKARENFKGERIFYRKLAMA